MRIKVKSQRDFWAGMLFTAIGAGFSYGALEYSFGAAARPGPGYFPTALGLVMALLGLLIIAESLLKRRAVDGDPIGSIAWKPLAIVLGAIALFGFLLPRAGLFVALPLLVILGSLAGERASLRTIFISAVVLTIGCWAVFVRGLGLSIPLWPSFLGS